MNIVNEALDPLHRLILSYARRTDQRRFSFLFAFDSKLADIIRTTSESLIGQMRLTWWRDNLSIPASDRPAGEPLITQLNELDPDDASMKQLLVLIDGWEAMLDDFPWDDLQFDRYARSRGLGFFGFALRDEGHLEEIAEIAKLWALWDFAQGCSDQGMREAAFDNCRRISVDNINSSFDRSGRPLSILCKLALHDAKNGRLPDTIYRPSTAARIIWHGVTGL